MNWLKDKVKELGWKKLMLIFGGVIAVSGIMCLIFQEGVLNTIFAVPGGISFAGLLIAFLMHNREKAVMKKEKNFTCRSCGREFQWDESKIQCKKISGNKQYDGKNIFYHYKIAVKWECECGEVNDFEITLSTRNEEAVSMIYLVNQYYLGNIVN